MVFGDIFVKGSGLKKEKYYPINESMGMSLMEKSLFPGLLGKKFLKQLLLTGALVLAFLFLPHLAKGIQEWQDPALRIERLQERTAEELRLYYQGKGNWLRCHRLLQRLERLQETANK